MNGEASKRRYWLNAFDYEEQALKLNKVEPKPGQTLGKKSFKE